MYFRIPNLKKDFVKKNKNIFVYANKEGCSF